MWWCVEIVFEHKVCLAGRMLSKGNYIFTYDNYEHANHVANKARELHGDDVVVAVWQL